MNSRFKTEEELISYAEDALYRPVQEFDPENKLRNPRSKGNIGHVMEKGFFKYPINNSRKPDFEELGIELKVTGYRKLRNGKVSAKERLVLSMINFMVDFEIQFYETELYQKLDKILFMFYEYIRDIDYYDFTVSKIYMYIFNNIPEKDKLIMINDFNLIMDKIKQGKAHEISEGDTFYLGACPKGKDSSSLVKQPFSDIPAMSRAYSLKTTYMTYLMREYIFKEKEDLVPLFKDTEKLKVKSPQDLLIEIFNPYVNKTLSELDVLNNTRINRNSKNYLRMYFSQMIHINENKLNSIEEFEKANITYKTIRVNKRGKIKEDMSFPAFDFQSLAQESWDDSFHKDYFSSSKFLFVIFDEIDDDKKEYRFRGVKLWNLSEDQIENEVKKCWLETNRVLNSKLILNIRNNRVYNNFPTSTVNEIMHVRPHAKNRNDTSPLPESTTIIIESNDGSVNLDYIFDEYRFTKQCFWFNSPFVENIIAESDNSL